MLRDVAGCCQIAVEERVAGSRHGDAGLDEIGRAAGQGWRAEKEYGTAEETTRAKERQRRADRSDNGERPGPSRPACRQACQGVNAARAMTKIEGADNGRGKCGASAVHVKACCGLGLRRHGDGPSTAIEGKSNGCAAAGPKYHTTHVLAADKDRAGASSRCGSRREDGSI